MVESGRRGLSTTTSRFRVQRVRSIQYEGSRVPIYWINGGGGFIHRVNGILREDL